MKFFLIKYAVLVAGLMMYFHPATGQNTVTLHIGDPAPALKYSKWIKGNPVTTFDSNRMYVVEFWATWCVPCKQAMPHLSELARNYKEKVTFIGVNSGEMTGGKPYDTVLPKVLKFVAEMGDQMDYEVFADNNEGYMGKSWMTAAGQSTIPVTFLIKEGKIVWIGHPDNVEEILNKVLSNDYDMGAFKSKFEGKTNLAAEAREKMMAVLMPVDELIKAGKYLQAMELIDKSIPENPSFALSLQSTKFATLFNYVSEKAALKYAREWTTENSVARYMVGKDISEKSGLTKETYEYAVGLFEQKRNEPKALKPVIEHLLAACYSKAGKTHAAVLTEEQALQSAKEALAAGKWPGAITAITITEYEESLKKYKQEK